MRMKSLLRFVGPMLVLASIASPGLRAQSDAEVAERPPILMNGQSPDLMAFYTGDVIGYLAPCG